ncbi:MAG: T9SS type A sorting domain-containing protein [Bacteroidota bacterium]
MKKITSLLTIFAIGSLAFGQGSVQKKTLPLKKNTTVTNKINNSSNENIADRAVIWSDDFSVSTNWVKASTAGAGLWTISTTGPSGAFDITPINSTTKANGFALFDSDLDCSHNQVANITTATPINCSTNPAVVLKFQQQYRRFDDSTFVFISNNGTTWVKYPVNTTLNNNDYCDGNPENMTINITATAGGQATVYVRFQFYSPSSLGAGAGCGYSWMIDDVSIEDQPSNDILLSSVYFGEYSRIPDGQQAPITLGAGIENVGAAAQTNVVLSATVNTTLFTGTSAPIASLPIGQTDTIAITNQFTPGAIGNYVVKFAAQQTQTDANPGNNITTGDTIKVTANTYARDNYTYEGLGSWNGAGEAFELGNWYSIVTNTYALSATFVLQGGSFPGSIVSVKLYDTSLTTVLASSNPYAILASDIPTSYGPNPKSITLPFTSPAALTADNDYLAVVEFLNDSGTDTIVIATGTDIIQPSQTTYLYDTPTSTWFTLASTPMIRLNVAVNVGINEVANVNGVTVLQNQPNPFDNLTTINYEMSKNAAVTLTVYDITGKKVAEQFEGNKNAGKHSISFKADNLSEGVYYYTLKADGNTTPAMKMVVIK